MATTQDYLDQLQADKANLVSILTSKGIEASDAETFTELIPKINNIAGGGYDGISVLQNQSIKTETEIIIEEA